MTTPDITSKLPHAVTLPQTLRLQTFLQHADQKLDRPWSITVYGSAAVAIYLADERGYEYGYTRDIDIGFMEPKEIGAKTFDTEIVDPPLHFQPYDFTLWLLHPDWKESTVDVSKLLGLNTLTMCLLHPIDLIITKLERAGDQDLEDGILIRERYITDVAEARSRTIEAAKYHPISPRARSQIEYAFEAIFEESIDLESFT